MPRKSRLAPISSPRMSGGSPSAMRLVPAAPGPTPGARAIAGGGTPAMSLAIPPAAGHPALQRVDDEQQDERRQQHHERDRGCAGVVVLLELGDDQQWHD